MQIVTSALTLTEVILDGNGGVWGEHVFEMPPTGFGDNLPAPEFMLREKEVEASLQRPDYWGQHFHRLDVECVGEEFDILRRDG